MTSAPKSFTTPEVSVVNDTIFSQVMDLMGLKKPNWLTRVLHPIFLPLINRISIMLVELDQNIVRLGWSSAVQILLDNFVDKVKSIGADNIPAAGPLLLSCNHPAAYDAFILAAACHRDDMKVLASDVPLVQKLPNIAEHIILVPYNIPSRLQTVRSVIHHLKAGGAVLIFPHGDVEPDPAVSPGAEESIRDWSPSLELFLRQVPDTISVVAISSAILSPGWFGNPFINLWKKYEQRQKVAEIFQVGWQLLTGKKASSTPLVSFSKPLTVDDLGGIEAPQGTLLAELIHHARMLLENHPHV
jgi:Acyltransferase